MNIWRKYKHGCFIPCTFCQLHSLMFIFFYSLSFSFHCIRCFYFVVYTISSPLLSMVFCIFILGRKCICAKARMWLKKNAKLSSVASLPWHSYIFLCLWYWRDLFTSFLSRVIFFCARTFPFPVLLFIFVDAFTHLVNLCLDKLSRKNITFTSVCQKLVEVIKKTSDISSLPEWRIPNVVGCFGLHRKKK